MPDTRVSVTRWLLWTGAGSDLERQLGQATAAAAAAVARRTPTGRGVPAGDEAGRCRIRRAARRPSWPSAVTRRRHGEAQWNGVAILSRVGLDDVRVGLPGAPGFPDGRGPGGSATCGGIRVHSVYVPNGRTPDSDHYHYKLAWLGRCAMSSRRARATALVCGDMNIAPADADVFDPAAYIGQTHVTPPERAALAELEALGLHDVVRERWPNEPGVHLLGLPGRDVSPGSRHAHRPRAGRGRGR